MVTGLVSVCNGQLLTSTTLSFPPISDPLTATDDKVKELLDSHTSKGEFLDQQGGIFGVAPPGRLLKMIFIVSMNIHMRPAVKACIMYVYITGFS